MKDENKIIAALAFIGGVAVGANWNRIKKYGGIAVNKTKGAVSKTYKNASKFLAVQKEHAQDISAEIKAEKKKTKG